ncbi:MAG TPA: DUF4038 domain-containing protein [Trebonia sp.]|jgi:hypothetical protein|nr:DUF4038 domain-containing protein [Trebonia sp.]
MGASRLSIRDGSFVVNGSPGFLLGDTVWAALSGATDDEWLLYLRHRAGQGFNAAYLSVLPIPHDRSNRGPAGPTPFDEDLVRREGRWELNPEFFDLVGRRLAQAAAEGMVCGLVLLWVNYVEGSWGAERTPGLVMPEDVQRRYLAALSRVVADGSALLIVSGDAGFASPAETGTYQRFTKLVTATWPNSVIAYHLTPDTVLPAELDSTADALIYQSGHYGDRPTLARTLARHYRASADGRPVLNAEPPYEAHRIAGGVGRFGRAAVRRQIWESVVAGASSGVTYGAHGLWGWHRNDDPFSSVHFSGQPLDWREALFLPGAADAAACRRIVEDEGLLRLVSPPPGADADGLTVADQGWGADQVIVGLGVDSSVAAVYLPNGGPVELRRRGPLRLRRLVDLEHARDGRAACARSADDRWIIDPRPDITEALLVLDLE